MTDLRHLREIEKLVQDSVFHPSPCHRLRDRVLQNAVQAKHRQKLWQRFVVASSAVTGMLMIVFCVMRFSAAKPAVATEAGPVSVRVYSPARGPRVPAMPEPTAVTKASLGEELYFHSGSVPDRQFPPLAGAAGGLRKSNPSTVKDLASNPE